MSKGKPPKQRSPQEKKTLSLKKDRRNTYGNNVKAARKRIPANKASSMRASRHAATQAVATLDRLPEAAAEVVESSVAKDVRRVKRWRKGRDEPLGEVVKTKLETRDRRKDNGKAARRRKRAALDLPATAAIFDKDDPN